MVFPFYATQAKRVFLGFFPMWFQAIYKWKPIAGIRVYSDLSGVT
jgi:hypothetical protein